MKQKLFLLFCVAVVITQQQVNAQNTFPATGYVGIGTPTPQNRLHVQSLSPNEGALIGHAPNGYWALLSGGSFGNGSYNGISRQNDAGIIYGGNAPGNASGFVIAPWANAASGLRMSSTGQVSLYSNSTLEAFEMNHSNNRWLKVFAGSLSAGAYNPITQQNDAGIAFGGAQIDNGPGFVIVPWATSNGGLRIQNNGSVQIGNITTPAGYKLFVEQGILTEKVKVAIKTTADWSDHVFNKNYPLMPLQQVEQFIQTNGHLPGIPSATEVVKEGIDLGKMNAKLLEKIEELTLYMLNLHKTTETQQKEITELKAHLQKQSGKH